MDEASSNLKETLKAIDAVIAEKRTAIKLGEALERLINNPDFKLVILDGYIEAEASKLFKILTDPSGATPYTDEQIHLKLEAISHFKGYVGTEDFLGTVRIAAKQAPLDIIREENYRNEVTATVAESGEY